MNIIFGKDELLESKYTVLELDTMMIPGSDQPVTAYCVVENIPVSDIANLDQYKDLHENLMKNYRLKNWRFCEDAIEYLTGKWNGEVDSFYNILAARVKELKENGIPDDWDGIIDKTV